jgi:SPP1 family predicted phage head-tail adaptor
MKSGMLRHKVLIQNPSESTDTQGGAEFTWTTVATAWAAVEPLSSREQYWQSQLQTLGTHKVTLRYTALVTSRSRILFGTRTFEITSKVNTEERGEELVLVCVEVQ